jgi:hypothetical protein
MWFCSIAAQRLTWSLHNRLLLPHVLLYADPVMAGRNITLVPPSHLVANQSSTLFEPLLGGWLGASRAIDGSYNTFTRTDDEARPWLVVDLQSFYFIAGVRIINRPDWLIFPCEYLQVFLPQQLSSSQAALCSGSKMTVTCHSKSAINTPLPQWMFQPLATSMTLPVRPE